MKTAKKKILSFEPPTTIVALRFVYPNFSVLIIKRKIQGDLHVKKN